MKKEGKIDRDIMVTNLVGCIGLGAAVDTLALFGCVVEGRGLGRSDVSVNALQANEMTLNMLYKYVRTSPTEERRSKNSGHHIVIYQYVCVLCLVDLPVCCLLCVVQGLVDAELEAVTDVLMKVQVFWDVAPFLLADSYRRSGETCSVRL